VGNSEGVFGGNGSVNWKVDVENPEKNSVKSERKQKPGSPNAWLQEGKDEAPLEGTPGAEFTISIELPDDPVKRKECVEGIRRAAENPQDGRVTFTLPIRRFHDEQIKITWPSGDTTTS
jgi:hypothetical protein